MTVATSVSRITVAGNGSATSFAFPFKITSSAHLVVTKTTSAGIVSTLTEGTHYSVTGVGSESGGSITYPLSGTALPTGDTLTMRRVVPLTQTTDLTNQGAFYAEVHEDTFDRLTYITQQLTDQLTDLDAIVDGLIGDVPGALRAYTFSGDGGTVLFSLGVTLTGGVRSVLVAVDGVLQGIDTYAVSGTSLIFSEAPPYGALIDVRVVGEAYSMTVTDTSLVTATGTTTPRTLSDRFAEQYNVKNFGEVGNGVTDDTAAFVAMFAAVEAAGGGSMYVPPGTYSIPSGFITGGTNALLPQCSNWSLKGAGRDLTIFKWGDGSDLFRRFSTDARISNVEMTGFTITGTWQTAQNDLGNYAFRLYGIDNVNIQDVGVRDVRNIAIVLRLCSGQVKDIDLLRIARDGVSVGTCRYMRVTNLRGEHIDDDIIGAHNTVDSGNPVPSVIEISNVTGIDTGRVAIQGACRVVASNIQLFRPREGGFAMSWVGSEGYNSALSVQVDGLVVNDVLNRNGIDGLSANCNYILIASRPINAGALAAAPGYPDAATGATVSSYAYMDANSLTSPRGAGRHVRVTNFQCVRTLEPVTKYSDWGYGTMFTRNGFLDPAITVAEIGQGRGCQLGSSTGSALEDVHIDNGTFSGHDHSIYLAGGDYKSVLIGEGVNCRNFKTGGFSINSGAVGKFENVIVRARFNGDPERQHASRAVANTGQWQNISTPIAVSIDTISGLILEGCHIMNVSTVVSGAGAYFARGVMLYADPTATGYNAGNFGIGNCPIPSPCYDFWYVIQDCDPTSANFGTIKNYCAQSSTAQPATGKYVKGMLILAKQPTVTTSGLTRGWYRNTTGTAHTTGASGDWQEVRDPFGDTATYSSSVRLTGGTGGVAQLEAYGTATNIDVQLTPKGTTGKVKAVLANVPTYADDAAATVGGLTAGHVYKTSTGILMIKL
jgi:hypothetical protein